MIVGYARVSTEEQNLDLQVSALRAQGCQRIYTDHGISGNCRDRPGLEDALRHLAPGAKLVVWKLDRLGRSVPHLITLLDDLARRGVLFHSVTEHIDTSCSGGRLLFHFLSALAEYERSLISERTRAGMAAAKARGAALGRPRRLSPEQAAIAMQRVDADPMALPEVATQLGVHRRTVERALSRLRAHGEGSLTLLSGAVSGL